MKAEAKDANTKQQVLRAVASLSRKAGMEGDASDIAQNKKDKKDDAASDSVFLKDAKVRAAYIGLAELFGLKMSDDKDNLEVGDFPEHLKLNFKEDRGIVCSSSPGSLSYQAFSLWLLKPDGDKGSDPRQMQEKKDIVWALAQTSAGSRMLQALLIWNELTEWPENYKVQQLDQDRIWLAGCFEDKIEQAHMGLGRKHANYVIQTICKHTTRVEMVAKEVVGKGGDLCLKMTLDQMGCRTLNRLVEKLLDKGMVVYGPMMLEILLKPETLKEVSQKEFGCHVIATLVTTLATAVSAGQLAAGVCEDYQAKLRGIASMARDNLMELAKLKHARHVLKGVIQMCDMKDVLPILKAMYTSTEILKTLLAGRHGLKCIQVGLERGFQDGSACEWRCLMWHILRKVGELDELQKPSKEEVSSDAKGEASKSLKFIKTKNPYRDHANKDDLPRLEDVLRKLETDQVGSLELREVANHWKTTWGKTAII